MTTRRVRRAFGLRIASDFPFKLPLPLDDGDADLEFRVLPSAPPEPIAGDPSVEIRYEDGEWLRAIRCRDFDVLHFSDLGVFHLFSDRIDCWPKEPVDADLLEIRFLRRALAFWLERSGILVLHAAGVSTTAGAVAFVASHYGGKSTLASAWMRAGWPLLTDDVLPIEASGSSYLARPGYPELRLWPQAVDGFFGTEERFELLHPESTKVRTAIGQTGEFATSPQPLAAIYVLDRQDGEDVSIESNLLSPREGLVELLAAGYLSDLIELLGWQPRRLDFMARVVEQVPVRRLRFPTDYARLPAVVEHVLSEVGAVAD